MTPAGATRIATRAKLFRPSCVNARRSVATAPSIPEEAKQAGSLFVWGRIDEARLGMKMPENLFSSIDIARGPTAPPIYNPNLRDVVQVVCRSSKTLALTKDGSVYSWGSCENLSLGHGDNVRRVGHPKKIDALAGIKIVFIDGNETSSAAVSEEGEVFTWGWGGSMWGGNGGLGHGNNVTQPRPALVEGLQGVKVRGLAVGATHMLAVSQEGKVYSWGNGEFGRLGTDKRKQYAPDVVELLLPHPVQQVAAGRDCSFALGKDGVLWGWGKNDASQLGLGAGLVADLNNMEAYPVKVELEGEDAHLFNGRVARIAAGKDHALAVTRDGSVYQWGARTFLSPTHAPLVSFMKEGKESTEAFKIVDVAAGDGVSAAIDGRGRLSTWGKLSHSSMLGQTAGLLNARNPARVGALESIPIAQVSCGTQHAAAIVGIPRSL